MFSGIVSVIASKCLIINALPKAFALLSSTPYLRSPEDFSQLDLYIEIT